MKRRYYSVETLEQELRSFEERYDLASDRFFDLYKRDEVPPAVPRFDSLVWADTYQESQRLQSSAPGPAA